MSLTQKQLTTLFWFVCIPTRLTIALILPIRWLRYLLPVISIGFLYLYLEHERLRQMNQASEFHSWAQRYEIIHAATYAAAWLFLQRGRPDIARYILVSDVLFGMYMWIQEHMC